MIETNPQFPEILPVIEQYLKDCKKEGKPMRIHFWDTNHQLDAAKQITADSSLHNLAKKYGSPLYVIEIVGGDDFTKLVPGYLAGDKHATKRIIEDYNFKSNKGKSVLKIVDYAKNDPNTRVLFPDHREAEVKAFVNSMPADEQVLYKKFDTLIKKAQKKLIESGFNENATKEYYEVILPNILEEFTHEEKLLIHKFGQKIQAIEGGDSSFDKSSIDEKIAANVAKVFKPDRDVQITVYGAAHFSKKLDLNERMEGLNIAIADSKNLKDIRKAYLDTQCNIINNELPEYVYYVDKHKLVKMDNDVAKAEFLGLDEKQFKEWAIRQNPNGLIKNSNQVKPPQLPDKKRWWQI